MSDMLARIPESDAERAGRAIRAALETPREHGSDSMFSALEKMMTAFEAELTERQEVGAMLASFGQTVTIAIETVSWQPPHLIVFEGVSNGKRCRLLQHQSQVNVLLVVVPVEGDRIARRIGFVGPGETK